MICQPVIFKKAKKVCEDPEKAGNEGNVDWNVHVCPNTAYIWKKQIRTRICRKREGKMKGKKPAMIGFFYGWLQKSFKNRQKSSKKVLTEGRDCDIITKLSARAKRRADNDDP